VKTIDWGQSGETMDESGAHDTRRGARRLARFPPGSVAKAYAMRRRVWNMVAPGRLVDATPGIDRDLFSAAKGTKKPPPRSGDERCQARGTTPVHSRIISGHLNPHGAMTRDAAAR
jgi:hypothetical protein